MKSMLKILIAINFAILSIMANGAEREHFNVKPVPKIIENQVYLKSAAGTINVKDYGAVGDGINDDTIAIQNALNFAFKQRKSIRVNTMKGWYGGSVDAAYPMVIFPSGTYKITNTLVGYREMYLKGIGNAVIKQFDSTKDIYYQHGSFRSTIENLTFDGGSVQVHIWTANMDGAKIIISNCQFKNSGSEAVRCWSYTKKRLKGEKFRWTKPIAPYKVEVNSNGFIKLVDKIDITTLSRWANSTLMVISDSEFNNCIRVFDVSCDGTVFENCKIIANPFTVGAVIKCNNKTEIRNIKCYAPASKQVQFWIEANSSALACRNSIFESASPMCLVKQIRKPGYISTGLIINGCKLNSAGCAEGGIISLEAIPNTLYFTGNIELSGKAVKAVAWKISPSTEGFYEQRYFKHIDIATQFNFCIANNSSNINPQLPKTAKAYIRSDIPQKILKKLGFANLKKLAVESSPQIKNMVFASCYGLKADGINDDSDALQQAVDAASKLPQSAVILPGQIIKLTKTIYLSPDTKLIGTGCAFLRGDGSFPALSSEECRNIIIKNIGFKEFSKGLELNTKSSQNSKVLIYNCDFFDCYEEAITCLSDKNGDKNNTIIQLKNSNIYSTIVTNAAFAYFSNLWLSGNFLINDRANIENHGGVMFAESISCVPRSKKGKTLKNSISKVEKIWEKGDNLRWFDNYGKLIISDPRFGGEEGGACPIYNMFQDSIIFAHGGYFGMNSKYIKNCYAYFVKAPEIAVFTALGNIPGPIARSVWQKASECGDVNSIIFISGPGVGLEEVPFKFVSGMNVLKNPGFENITIMNVEKMYPVLFKRGVNISAGPLVPMPTGWSLNKYDGWQKGKACAFKCIEGKPGKEVFTGKRAVRLASNTRATISGKPVKVVETLNLKEPTLQLHKPNRFSFYAKGVGAISVGGYTYGDKKPNKYNDYIITPKTFTLTEKWQKYEGTIKFCYKGVRSFTFVVAVKGEATVDEVKLIGY